MPELAEVEITRRQLLSWWPRGQSALEVVVHDETLLDEEDATALAGPLLDVRRRGKHLCLTFHGLHYALLHLRMTGKLVRSPHLATKAARLSWQLAEHDWIHFEDSRRLGTLTLHDDDPLLHHAPLLEMGPEPHDLADGAALRKRLGKTRRRLKDALLDQRVIAGVGNIAISELFFTAKIPPKIRAHEISDAHLDALVEAMPPYFDKLVDDHPIDTPMQYVNQPGDQQSPFAIYAHEHELCPRCAQTPIARDTFGGRSTYYCPSCQAE